MFRKLADVPECLGNIDGVDYDADISVRAIEDYDKGEEECFGEFCFEDIN